VDFVKRKPSKVGVLPTYFTKKSHIYYKKGVHFPMYHSEGYCHTPSRAEEIGKFVSDTGATVRAAAQRFGVSKSTVHKDLTWRLKMQNPILYQQVQSVLRINKEERHKRGGNATRLKYLAAKQDRY
jgi:putative DeoR family transcriptional regulator (stage III sporulation protein D)